MHSRMRLAMKSSPNNENGIMNMSKKEFDYISKNGIISSYLDIIEILLKIRSPVDLMIGLLSLTDSKHRRHNFISSLFLKVEKFFAD
jgi:hypothetical protein